MELREQRYGLVAVILHWLMAILIFFLFGLGWYMADLPQGPARSACIALHKSVGITVFGLAVFRVIWRWTHHPPPLSPTVDALRRTLANATHVLLYLMIFLQPITGYLSSSFSGYKTKYFGIPLPHWGWSDPPLNELFTDLHVICSMLLLILIATHIAGALSHGLTRGDTVLRRMLPRLSRGD